MARRFRRLIEGGAPIVCAGAARERPEELLSLGYTPKSRVDLFDTSFYLTRPRQNPDLRYFVAYVVQRRLLPKGRRGRLEVYPRIFYKDISLIWRVGSHLVLNDDELWVGKGDTREMTLSDGTVVVSDEATTDLPFELQHALEQLNQQGRRVPFDEAVLPLVLRTTTADRIPAYADFTAPRRRAAEDPARRIHGGRPVVYFRRPGDPGSLTIAQGYEPDWSSGVVELTRLRSSFYGGPVRRFRVVSANRIIQYLFYLAPRHTWAIPPQTQETELSSYGVRTIEPLVDDDAFVPGYEYHFVDDSVSPPVLHSQIPEGFAGRLHPRDENRADASAWLERLPLIRDARRYLSPLRRGRIAPSNQYEGKE